LKDKELVEITFVENYRSVQKKFCNRRFIMINLNYQIFFHYMGTHPNPSLPREGLVELYDLVSIFCLPAAGRSENWY